METVTVPLGWDGNGDSPPGWDGGIGPGVGRGDRPLGWDVGTGPGAGTWGQAPGAGVWGIGGWADALNRALLLGGGGTGRHT